MKLRRVFILGGAFLLVIFKFALDVVEKNVELDLMGLGLIRELLIIGSLALLYLVIDPLASRRESTPVRKLGFLLITMCAMILAAIGLSASGVGGFDTKNQALVPLDYPSIFLASLVAVAFGVFSIIVYRLLRDMILINRKPAARRNWLIFSILLLGTSASCLTTRALDSSVATNILFGFAILFAVMNSFRLPWIVYLTKREKLFSLASGFFLFVGFTAIAVQLGGGTLLRKSLLYYSHPLFQFVQLVAIFGALYAGTAFVSTLFHLPTAEAFDRKRSEVSSLHTLSKLVTQVFDFNELVDNVTSMTLQVVGASSCWLEIIASVRGEDGASPREEDSYAVQVAAMKNITQDDIDMLVSPERRGIRDSVVSDRKAIVVDDIERDPRFAHLKKRLPFAGSLVVVPLVSHTGLAGILYATKKESFGFVRDDVEAISAFADQATVAIENSRLIRESLEKERLYREMLVAQEMQKRLLPQHVPEAASIDLDAISTPAFEVGGDYYDFMELPDGRIGIAVGDVSGKGVSAAFYMSEMKGIFQALGRICSSPKEFMVKANEALADSIDKHSFVSLIYAILDPVTGRLTVARAGHCPMLHIRGEEVAYVRPNGLGMGLSRGAKFDDAIQEEVIILGEADVCVFYTDGVTEARCGDDEFGYERLMTAARAARGKTAAGIKEEILDTVSRFTEHRANDDDLTLVVLKWNGSARRT
ncbi:MAG TPA: SpoIIE family protein phosphatase [Bacteroidota bacterium]|nr:SpoIIE family protein phosphatase [Bacteroidota bacterium]